MLDTVKEMASSFVFKNTPQSVVRRNLQLNIINGDTSGAYDAFADRQRMHKLLIPVHVSYLLFESTT